MKKAAFLTTDNLDGFVTDDELLREPLETIGWTVQPVSWRAKNIDWNAFDIVIIRTPWDYQNDYRAFLTVLENIERSSAQLENGIELVRWNIRKTYLRDLEARGIDIVSTIWGTGLDATRLCSLFIELHTGELVLKPTISANADYTFRLSLQSVDGQLSELESVFGKREWMAQPFMERIIDEGEFSLMYFTGSFSHCILKTPKPGDFRVQEEHGATITAVLAEPALIADGNRVLTVLGGNPLYARADFVRTCHNDFALMELELIEPALYFRMDPSSPRRFAQALERHMRDRVEPKGSPFIAGENR